MARALIVGCGCRGRALGSALLERGWAVRGTTRTDQGFDQIQTAGIEPALADPDRVGTLLEQLDGVALVAWLMGSARGEPEALAALHGPRLERFMEGVVDTPVRGMIYEAAGRARPEHLRVGSEIVARAARTWRIPVRVVDRDPADAEGWLEAMRAAALNLAG